jgi:hypothetical protein
LRNPLSPKTRNIRPSRIRATRTAIFMTFSLKWATAKML